MLIGTQAPDFITKAFYRGEVKDIRLSDYRGHWVGIEFYPGDFTFV